MCLLSRNSGSLNLLEPWGAVQPVIRIVLHIASIKLSISTGNFLLHNSCLMAFVLHAISSASEQTLICTSDCKEVYLKLYTSFLSSWTSWPLKMRPICWPETPAQNYHSTLHNIPEGRKYHPGVLSQKGFSYPALHLSLHKFRLRELVKTLRAVSLLPMHFDIPSLSTNISVSCGVRSTMRRLVAPHTIWLSLFYCKKLRLF
jgi:hypothetical protein